MFDTVRMRANATINPELLPKGIMVVDEDTGEVKRACTIQDSEIPYIRYSPVSGRLRIQVSIPKYLYGTNTTLIGEQDIKQFWERLTKHLTDILQVEIAEQEWVTERIDVCWNFFVGEKIEQYMRALSKQRVPFLNTVLYNHVETVVFSNATSRISFYDKQKECIMRKDDRSVIDRAKGILRLEVKPSKYEMTGYSQTRKAVDLLTKKFFEYIMGKERVQDLLVFTDMNTGNLDFASLHGQSIGKVEKSLAFQALRRQFDESALKRLYTDDTLRNRHRLVQELPLYKEKLLPDLKAQLPNCC